MEDLSQPSLQVLLALLRLAREPSTFSEFKSVQQPKILEPFGLPILAKNARFGAVGNANIEAQDLTPDPKLYGHLRLLHSHALLFLFLHEIAHVLLGHIEFCWSAKHKALEMAPAERGQWLQNELRPLEFLADQYASRIGAALIQAGIFFGDAEFQDRRKATFENLKLWGLAVGVVSLLYEHFSPETGLHPPAAHRTLFIKVAPHSDFPGTGISPQEIGSCINEGIEEVTRGWDRLGWPRDQQLPHDVDAFLAPIENAQQRCQPPKEPPMASDSL